MQMQNVLYAGHAGTAGGRPGEIYQYLISNR